MAKTKTTQLDFGLIITDPQAYRHQQQCRDRRCLSCSKTFLSAGPHNRVCLKCKDLDGWSSPAASYAIHAAF